MAVLETGAARLALATAFASIGLGGCVDQMAQVAPDPAAQRPALERKEGVTLAAATVAIVSVAGAPGDLGPQFRSDLEDAILKRDVALTDDSQRARYLVRGYLSASPVKEGAEVEYVWDVFGPDKRRAFRLNDVIDVKGTGEDPWALVTPAALASIAGRSADDLAAFLSQTPEAKPLADAGGAAMSYAQTQ